MTFDFSHLEVKADKIVEYPIREIDCPPGTKHPKTGEPLRHPILLIRPATEANKPYWSRSIKRTARAAQTRIGVGEIDEMREDDLELFSEFVVAGWYCMPDKDGNFVDFSMASCRQLLSALADKATWVFTNLRIFAKDPTNFIEDGHPSAQEVVDQGNG